MKAPVADRAFHELVAAIVAAEDPTLLRRSCAALDIILAEGSEREIR